MLNHYLSISLIGHASYMTQQIEINHFLAPRTNSRLLPRRGRKENRSEAATDCARQYRPQSERKELSRTPSTASQPASVPFPVSTLRTELARSSSGLTIALQRRRGRTCPRGEAAAISGLHKKVDLVRQKPVEAVGRGHSSREAARPGCTTFAPISSSPQLNRIHSNPCPFFRPSSPAR